MSGKSSDPGATQVERVAEALFSHRYSDPALRKIVLGGADPDWRSPDLAEAVRQMFREEAAVAIAAAAAP